LNAGNAAMGTESYEQPSAHESARKSGFVSIVGRPNAGKSTLLNRLVGDKISIVTPSAQTTRNVVRGILSEPRGQVVFLDTPGIHKPHYRMNERMMRLMLESLDDVDVVVLIADASASFGRGEQFALELVSGTRPRRFLLLNKIDRIPKMRLLPLIGEYTARCAFDQVIPISARDGDGVGAFVDEIFSALPVGPSYYPEDQLSDRPERFLAAEAIREKLILETREELPHATAIAIEKYEENDRLVRIFAAIYVERDSQKAIVIGKGGQLLKRVGIAARQEIETLVGRQVHLELHVKVRKKWRDDDQILESLGI
jgi:GTP-binding protein Era